MYNTLPGYKKDFVIDSTRAKIQNPFFFYTSMFFCLAMSKKKCNFASQNKGCYIWIIRVHNSFGKRIHKLSGGCFSPYCCQVKAKVRENYIGYYEQEINTIL